MGEEKLFLPHLRKKVRDLFFKTGTLSRRKIIKSLALCEGKEKGFVDANDYAAGEQGQEKRKTFDPVN